MSLLHVNYWSPALEKQCGMYLLLPESARSPYRVVYQLHGLSDDYTIWLRRTSIERYAEKLGLVIALLDGGRTFYIDRHPLPGRYESHILDSVAYVDATLRTLAAPEGRAIGGLSMGGYGAVKIGLKHPEVFCSAASHSGAVDAQALLGEALCPEFNAMFPAGLDPAEDPFALAAQPGVKPSLYLDCGVDDFLLEQNRRFHAHLQKLGVPHHYKEYPGAHSWDYWDRHITAALLFHARQMARVVPVVL